jgi:hypothetical protein
MTNPKHLQWYVRGNEDKVEFSTDPPQGPDDHAAPIHREPTPDDVEFLKKYDVEVKIVRP